MYITRYRSLGFCRLIGALFLQALFEKFDSTYARERAPTAEAADTNDDEAVGSKEVNNYLTLLCYLAIFEVSTALQCKTRLQLVTNGPGAKCIFVTVPA